MLSKMNIKKLLLIVFFVGQYSFAQEGIAVYSDYLSDNYYLLHPSMAGASSCSKLRLTGRQQWFGQEDAPSLQTLSFNGKIGESDQSGAGVIVYNDKNGYHSQKGIKATYAHHIMFSRDAVDLNQVSFGMSVGLTQSILDQSEFLQPGDFDPLVSGNELRYSYFNVDLGMSYNYLEFYTHVTVKNAIETRRKIYTGYESDDIRKVIINSGYVFGNEDGLLWEPSVMFQLVNQTKEKTFDVNLKVYKQLEIGRLWGGLSYRRSLDGAEFISGGNTAVEVQKLQYITPIVGINYKNYMFSYTYSAVTGAVRFDNGGFHQITLGMNIFCKAEKYHCNCPAINP